MLILFITLAAVLPFPIPVFSRDKSPKYIMEQVDKDEDEGEDEML